MSFKGKQSRFKTLTEDTLNYYKRIKEVLQDDNSIDVQVIDNIFSQLTQEAVAVCKHPETSAIIELLINHASCANVASLLQIFATDWDAVCNDSSASHVVQKCVLVSPKLFAEQVSQFDIDNCSEDSSEDQLILKILSLCEHILNNLEKCLTHTHMSHIVRSMLQILGGTFVDEKILKSKGSRNYSKKNEPDRKQKDIHFQDFDVPAAFRKQLKFVYKTIFRLENFGVYITESNANPILQTLLLVLNKANAELCQKAINKVIKRSRIKDDVEQVNLPPVAADSIGSFLVEQIIGLCSEELFRKLFERLFHNRLLQFATHAAANYVLQTFIRKCRDKDIFKSVVDELNNCISAVLDARNYGVLVAMVETAEKLTCKQDSILQMLMTGLQCWEPEERRTSCVALLAAFTTHDNFHSGSHDETSARPAIRKVNYHGSLLLQHLVNFRDVKMLETGFLDLQPGEVSMLACDPCGSHVMEAAFRSAAIREKTKEGLVSKMAGSWVQLACHKNGSHTLEFSGRMFP
ncbi:nucleolar protein 9-like [Dreissena polymorpha]|uniref:Nucleolar protein 9 n=1 Tax=Dreissena polymorpha TaxID=45954 RepID=A0A9D4DX20_DREPO|nr:nucleolar protein 9-like [Dreissena polymorpha]KAH3768385.1 hypothetical protein DPMN_169597 [Dreissena polymorpha]